MPHTCSAANGWLPAGLSALESRWLMDTNKTYAGAGTYISLCEQEACCQTR